jgi:hypothetical protein
MSYETLSIHILPTFLKKKYMYKANHLFVQNNTSKNVSSLFHEPDT